MFNAKRETPKNADLARCKKGVATLWGTLASCPQEPGRVFRERSPYPGRLSIEFNSYFTQDEINDITYSCAENFEHASRNRYVCEKLLDVAKQKNENIRWFTVCGLHWVMAQIQQSRDSVFLAKFGALTIGVFKGSYTGGRVA